MALFIASIGLILSPVFLLNHLLVLGAGLSVLVIAKTALVSDGYLMGGMSLNEREDSISHLAVAPQLLVEECMQREGRLGLGRGTPFTWSSCTEQQD